MSENVQKFIEAINGSDDLAQAAQDALDGSEDPTAFVELAVKNGYEVTNDDVSSYFGDLLSAGKPAEIKDEDLENVAGGKDVHYNVGRPGLLSTIKMFRSFNFSRTPTWTGWG